MTKGFKAAYKTSIILLSSLAAVLISCVILIVLSAPVGKTFYTIVIMPLTRSLHITELLIRAIPLCIIALGVSVAYRSGIINIGAEGQMAMGILAYTAVSLSLPDAPQFYSFCLRVVMMDPAEKMSGGGTPQSARLAENAWLGRISGRLHYGIIIALVLAFLVYIYMWKTTYGYKMRASGAEARAARYGGINVNFYVILAMVISGAFAGLAGGVEIAGLHRRAIEGVTNNYGFSAVVVSLFGLLHPAGIVPASFFFGLLIYGSTLCPINVGVPANIINVMQGIIILVIVTAQMVLSNNYLEEKVWRKYSNWRKKDA